jgi:hypothetical protein
MLHVNGKYRAAKYLNAIHCFKRSDLISQPKKIERLRRITFLGVMDPKMFRAGRALRRFLGRDGISKIRRRR